MQRKKPKSWCKSHKTTSNKSSKNSWGSQEKRWKRGRANPETLKEEKRTFQKKDWDRRTQPFNKGIGQRKRTFEKGCWTEEEGLWKRKRTFEKGDWDRRTHVNLERGNVKRFNLWEKAPFTSEAKPLYRLHSSWIFLKTYPWISPWSAMQLALKSPHGSHHLLFHQIPGVSTKFVRGDALHILFCRGIYRHLLGSVLHYLCWFDGKGKQGRHQLKGSVLCVGKFRKLTKNLAAPPGWATFGSRCFLMSNSLTRPFPTLSIKGSEAKHLLPPCWRHLAWQVHARCHEVHGEAGGALWQCWYLPGEQRMEESLHPWKNVLGCLLSFESMGLWTEQAPFQHCLQISQLPTHVGKFQVPQPKSTLVFFQSGLCWKNVSADLLHILRGLLLLSLKVAPK